MYVSFQIYFLRNIRNRFHVVTSFRCVQDDERSFAIGVQWCFMRFLGTVMSIAP